MRILLLIFYFSFIVLFTRAQDFIDLNIPDYAKKAVSYNHTNGLCIERLNNGDFFLVNSSRYSIYDSLFAVNKKTSYNYRTPHPTPHKMAETSKDLIWVVGQNTGVRLIDRSKSYPKDVTEVNLGFSPSDVSISKDDEVLITFLGSGLSVLMTDSNWYHFNVGRKNAPTDFYTAGEIFSINHFFASTSDGLYEFKAGKVNHYGVDEGLLEPKILDLELRNDTLFFITIHTAGYFFDGSFFTLSIQTDNQFLHIDESENNRLYFVSERQIFKYSTNSIVPLPQLKNQTISSPIIAFEIDEKNRFILITEGNETILNNGFQNITIPKIDYYFPKITWAEGAPNNSLTLSTKAGILSDRWFGKVAASKFDYPDTALTVKQTVSLENGDFFACYDSSALVSLYFKRKRSHFATFSNAEVLGLERIPNSSEVLGVANKGLFKLSENGLEFIDSPFSRILSFKLASSGEVILQDAQHGIVLFNLYQNKIERYLNIGITDPYNFTDFEFDFDGKLYGLNSNDFFKFNGIYWQKWYPFVSPREFNSDFFIGPDNRRYLTFSDQVLYHSPFLGNEDSFGMVNRGKTSIPCISYNDSSVLVFNEFSVRYFHTNPGSPYYPKENVKLDLIFNIVPNPAQDFINVKFSFLSPLRESVLSIYNTSGILVYEKHFERFQSGYAELLIKVSDFKPGLYSLTLNSNEKSFSQKFIKE